MLFYPVVFPSLPYFGQVIKQGNWKILADFTYQKSLHCNRYVVPLMNKDVVLSVPLKKFGKDTRFSELEISYAENWVRVHLGTLRAGYGKAPYFEYYADTLEAIFSARQLYFIDLCKQFSEFIAKASHIETSWVNDFVEEEIYVEEKEKYQPTCNYVQVFEPTHKHCMHASAIDLIFNKGPFYGEAFRE